MPLCGLPCEGRRGSRMMRVALGQVWARRVVGEPDPYDRVVVIGLVEQTSGANEWCLRPADSFGDSVSTTAADLEAAFSLSEDAPATDQADLYTTGEHGYGTGTYNEGRQASCPRFSVCPAQYACARKSR